jgi:hypothetical protein
MLPFGNDLKEGDALSQLLFNFALEYAFRTVQLALTSPTGGGRSVGIVRSRTKATEFFFFFFL